MTRIVESVLIERPVSEVFRYATDCQNIPRYFTYVREARLRGTEVSAGRPVLECRVLVAGLPLRSVWTTDCFEADERWEVIAPLLGIPARKSWVFSPEGAATRVTFTIDYKATPFYMAAGDVLVFRPFFKRAYRQGMSNLKRLLQPGDLR